MQRCCCYLLTKRQRLLMLKGDVFLLRYSVEFVKQVEHRRECLSKYCCSLWFRILNCSMHYQNVFKESLVSSIRFFYHWKKQWPKWRFHFNKITWNCVSLRGCMCGSHSSTNIRQCARLKDIFGFVLRPHIHKFTHTFHMFLHSYMLYIYIYTIKIYFECNHDSDSTKVNLKFRHKMKR